MIPTVGQVFVYVNLFLRARPEYQQACLKLTHQELSRDYGACRRDPRDIPGWFMLPINTGILSVAILTEQNDLP